MSVVRTGQRGLLARPLAPVGLEAGAAILADWLFWDHGVGLSFAIFCIALAVAAHLRRPSRRWRRSVSALWILIFGLAPVVDQVSPLSVAFALLTTAAASGLALPMTPSISRALLEAAARWIAGPGRLCRDLDEYAVGRRRGTSKVGGWTERLAWALPLAAAAVFLALFADANPVIADALSGLPWPTVSLATLMPRALFWIGVAVVVRPIVRPRRLGQNQSRARAKRASLKAEAFPPALRAPLLGETATLRALLLCIGLFALQLTLDGTYLLAGAALPHGMTYAQYAHRGAYPLVLTALLAGAFVLLLRREEAGAVNPRLTKGLLLLFTSQNILLVGSAAWRLGLYVGAYGLTEWRVAAFCWMGLVACGLALIAMQVASDRSNGWLASRAALLAAATLYGWCLADVPGIVARYDVAHCVEVAGVGPALDLDMLLGLGPSALPAITAVQNRLHLPAVDAVRDEWASTVRQQAGDWRTWSFRAWRLERWLNRIDTVDPTGGSGERQAQ